MPRTFKFSFPLPGRKPRSGDEDVNANLQPSYNNEVEDYPHCGPGLKAEAVLGTSDPSPSTPSEKPPFWSRKPSKYSSYMSVTISDHESATPLSTDRINPTSRNGSVASSRRPELSRNQPSSPLLGNLDRPRGYFLGDSSRLISQSKINSPSSPARRFQVSHQAHHTSLQTFPTSGSARSPSPSFQGCGFVDVPRTEGTHGDRDTHVYPRPKPPPLELIGLLQPPNIGSPSISSPHLYIKPQAQTAAMPRRMGSILGRGKWFGRDRKRKDSTTNQLSDQQGGYFTSQGSGGFPEQSQWLHDMNEVDEGEEPNHEDLVGYPLSEDPISCLISGRSDVVQRRKNSVNKNDHPYQSATPGKDPRSIDVATKSRSNTLESTQSRGGRSSKSHTSTTSGGSLRVVSKKQHVVDWLNHSVLSLSSSEDECDDPIPLTPQRQRHRVTGSFDAGDKGDFSTVSSVPGTTPLKARSMFSKGPRKPRSRSNSSDVVPPVPSIPARPLPTPRVSSIRWQERMTAHNAIKEIESISSVDSHSFSTAGRSIPHSRSNSQQRKPSLTGRVMAVTQEEEQILENMRRKRASIRTESSGDARSLASLLGGSIRPAPRPKTSGDERKSQEVLLDGQRMLPLSGHDLAKTLNGLYSVSADSLPQGESFPFPQMASYPEGTASLSSPSNKYSPGSLLTSSEAISSPTSRHSPQTPSDYSPEAFPQIPQRSPFRMSTIETSGKHKRERTISSGVVVLDGAEQKARQLESGDDLAGWPTHRYPW